MEDWEQRLAAMNARLVAWNGKFEAELVRVCKERKLRGWFKKPTRGELDAAAIEARQRAGVEVLGEAVALFDAVCEVYAKALPQERAKIRARVGSHEAVFDLYWNYVETSPERIRSSADAPLVERALTAISIDDLRSDYHDLNVVVGRLILAATTAGIDWKPLFKAAARISNPGTGGGGAHMREYLVDFDQSAYFKVEIAPRLRAAARQAEGLMAGGARR